LYKFLNIKSYLNFYGAIVIAFFFNFIFSNNIEQNFNKCLWIKSDELNNEESTKNIISKAYRSDYKIIFLQLDIHNDYRYNPFIKNQNKQLDFDPLNTALYWSNLYDIEIHIWINAYKIWSSTWPPNSNHIFYKLKEQHKDWFASDINGHSDYSFEFRKTSENFSGIFLSPLNQEVNIYIENIVEKLLYDYKGKFHGIHLDYFRYKDSMYGYNYIGRKTFYDTYGIDPIYLNSSTPSINSGLNDSIHFIKNEWVLFKNSHIDSLIKGLHSLIVNYNEVKSKNIKLSVAVKPDIYEAKIRWNQNWDNWLKNNFIDFAVVMNYYPDTESFSNNLWNLYKYFYSSKSINNIYIGINTIEQSLGSKKLRDINLIKDQVQNVQDFSFPGIAIFSSEYYKFNPTLYLEIFSEKEK
tara:strand:+ start:3003 stop:4229 length:1227 start_codon:yes stop_codon:yes gene_type:complete